MIGNETTYPFPSVQVQGCSVWMSRVLENTVLQRGKEQEQGAEGTLEQCALCLCA